jgi:formimidoylglutamate deiminase
VIEETGWLADCIYTGGEFESGLAMFADPAGHITRFSRAPDDLSAAQGMPGRAILPGIANVHSHAFQRLIRGRTEHRTSAQRDTFWTWRDSMYRAANRLTPELIYDAARMAFLEMLLAGITTVGEFHYVHHDAGGAAYADRNLLALEILRAAEDVGIRIALLRAAYVRAGWRTPPDPAHARFVTPLADRFIADTERLRAAATRGRSWVGVAAHSIRAAPIEYVAEIAAYARANALPIHMHVAEQPAEVDACIAEHGMRPVELLKERGILEGRFTAIHAIHVTDGEIADLAWAGARVGVCPTTERNLGDGAAPADRLFAAGVGVCLGSDSNVQIDPFEDARLIEYHLRIGRLERGVLAPDTACESLAKLLFDSATETGAASLQSPGGRLQPGRPADFFTVDLEDPSIAGAVPGALLTNIVFSLSKTAVRDVYVGGGRVIGDGRHPRQEEIVHRFAEAQRRLWSSEP